jgi:hypothetical protein
MKDVRIICEPNEQRWPDAATVAHFASFSIVHPGTIPFVNGEPAQPDDVVEPGDTIEFIHDPRKPKQTYRSIDDDWEV